MNNCQKRTTKTNSVHQQSALQTVTLNIDEYNDLKTRLAQAGRLNAYLEPSGSLWKEAHDKLKVESNNAIVKNEFITNQLLSCNTFSTSAS